MASVNSLLYTLRSDIENLKQSLCHTNDTLKQIDSRKNGSRFNGPPRVSAMRKRLSSGLMTGPPRQRQRISSRNQDKESADEEDDYQAHTTIPSSVVATNKDNHSREEVIRQQNKDKEGIARNRRMFGMLMGTLHQFKVDERRNEQQERKRKEVEKKLEEKQKEEEVKMRMERDKLFVTKKQQIIKLRKLELMMGVVELHETWEEQSMQLKHFIRTDSKPNIYYLPKQHNDASLKKLDSSRKLIEAIVSKRRNLLNDDIKKILNADHLDDADDDDGEEVGRPVRNDITSRNKRGDKAALVATRDHDEFDLDLNKNEVVGVDYQTSFDQSTKQDPPHNDNGDNDNNGDDNNNNSDDDDDDNNKGDNDDNDNDNEDNNNKDNNNNDIDNVAAEDKVNDNKINDNNDVDDDNGVEGPTTQEKMGGDTIYATAHTNDDDGELPIEKNGKVDEVAAEIEDEKKDNGVDEGREGADEPKQGGEKSEPDNDDDA